MSYSALALASALVVLTACSVVVGVSLQRLAWPERERTPIFLAAPTIGIAAFTVIAFWLAELGVPLLHGGRFAVLACASIALARAITADRTWWTSLAKRAAARHFAIAIPPVVAVCIVGAPIAIFAANYLAFGNGDWTFYLLNAKALVLRGYGLPHDLSIAAIDRDLSIQGTIQLATTGRQGAELLLATTSSFLGISLTASYLVLSMFAQGAITCGAMAMAWQENRRPFLTSMIAGIAVATAPLLVYGYILQLLPQNLGIAYLACNAVAVTAIFRRERSFSAKLVPCVVGIAAQFLTYPELIPFLVFGVILLLGVMTMRRESFPWPLAVAVGASSLAVDAPAASNGIRWITNAATKLAPSVGPTGETVRIALYPSFLHPLGILDYWGSHAVGREVPDGVTGAMLLALGCATTLLCAAGLLRSTLAGGPAGLIGLPMLAFALRFFAVEDDFASFKTSMYSQAFAWSALALLVAAGLRTAAHGKRLRSWSAAVLGFAMVLVVLEFGTARSYLERSVGGVDSPGFVTIRAGTTHEMLARLERAAAKTSNDDVTISDALNTTVEELDGLEFTGKDLVFEAHDEYPNLLQHHQMLTQPNGFAALIAPAAATYAAAERRRTLYLPSGGGTNSFLSGVPLERALRLPTALLLHDDSSTFVLNHPGSSPDLDSPTLSPVTDYRGLLFLPSSLGGSIWSGNSQLTQTLYFPEHDFARPNGWVQGMSEWALFDVPNPSRGAHLLVDETVTPFGGNDGSLATARVDGAVGAVMHFVGGGSARLYSTSVSPQREGAFNLVQLDLGGPSRRHPRRETDRIAQILTSLHRDVSDDNRYLTSFVREISLVPDSAYRRLVRPTRLATFPDDLYDRGLEYSGIYEDGWLSTSAFVRFREVPRGTPLRLRGLIPRVGDNENVHYRVTVSVGGGEHIFDEQIGHFEIVLPTEADGRPTDLRVTVSPPLRLADPDGRDVGFAITSIGYAEERDDLATHADGVAFGVGWYPLEHFGGSTFRWLRSGAEFTIDRRTAGPVTLTTTIEGGPSLSTPTASRLVVDDASGAEVARAELTGRTSVTLRLPAAVGTNRYTFHVDGTTGRAASTADPRTLDLRVFSFDAY